MKNNPSGLYICPELFTFKTIMIMEYRIKPEETAKLDRYYKELSELKSVDVEETLMDNANEWYKEVIKHFSTHDVSPAMKKLIEDTCRDIAEQGASQCKEEAGEARRKQKEQSDGDGKYDPTSYWAFRFNPDVPDDYVWYARERRIGPAPENPKKVDEGFTSIYVKDKQLKKTFYNKDYTILIKEALNIASTHHLRKGNDQDYGFCAGYKDGYYNNNSKYFFYPVSFFLEQYGIHYRYGYSAGASDKRAGYKDLTKFYDVPSKSFRGIKNYN